MRAKDEGTNDKEAKETVFRDTEEAITERTCH